MEIQLENAKVTPRLTERITAARKLWMKVLPSVDLPGHFGARQKRPAYAFLE